MDIIAPDLSLHLPNIRACFLPDDGYALVEADLARADAFSAAWDAGATELKELLASDHDIHSENADLLFGHQWNGRRFVRTKDVSVRSMHVNGMSFRDCAKRWVHATNFAGGARTVASAVVLPEDYVQRCMDWWTLERHPQLARWHRRVKAELMSRKMPIIKNVFGFRKVFSGGDRTSNLLGQALAWICQSQTAIVINKGMLNVDCGRDMIGQEPCGVCLHCRRPSVEFLLQIHDSLLVQLPLHLLQDVVIRDLINCCRIEVPYPDPLFIPVEVKFSTKNWGTMEKWQHA